MAGSIASALKDLSPSASAPTLKDGGVNKAGSWVTLVLHIERIFTEILVLISRQSFVTAWHFFTQHLEIRHVVTFCTAYWT